MVSITLSVSEEIRNNMRKHDEVNWSAIVRKTIEQKVNELVMKEQFLKQIQAEKPFNEWAVNIIRKGRKR